MARTAGKSDTIGLGSEGEGGEPAGSAVLEARGVTKRYFGAGGVLEALKDISISVPKGQLLAVMGPSGSGKTTMLNCLSGLDDIDEGEIWVDGRSLGTMSDAERTRHRSSAMGFIFQSFNLVPVLSAIENVELPLLLAGVKPSEARVAAANTLERIGLGARYAHRPAELSGGEQQRVAVARALAGRPALVWADEPTGNLDSESAASVMKLLTELSGEGMTVILVTHDAALAGQADRRVSMRDGRIVGDELLIKSQS